MLHDAGGIAIWNADSGALIKALTEEDFGAEATGAIFTPDSNEIVVNARGDVLGISTSTWTIQRRGQLDPTMGGYTTKFLGFLPDGTLIALTGVGGTAGGSLLWIDPDDMTTVRPPVRAHVGSPKSGALSPDGTKIVTGAADGVVRVWDSGSGALLHEFRVTGQAQGVAFLGNDRIAVTPYTGNIEVFLLDPDALVAAARTSLTRSFTPEECDQFGFEDACPTLDELRASAIENGG